MEMTDALVFRRANEPRLEQVPVPELRPDEVLVRTHYSGVSIGTEQSIFSGQRTHNGSFPCVTGYMSTGVVEAVGSNIGHVKPGDRVTASNARLEGEVQSVWGAHLALRVVRGSGLMTVPANVSMAQAALWTMPSVGLHALNMLNPEPGQVLVVQGMGLIGQFFGQFARQRGCRVIAIEPDPRRAQLARQYVTPDVLDPRQQNLAESIQQLTQGQGPDAVIEATGSKQFIAQASSLLRMGSRFVFLAWYPQQITLDYSHFHNHAITALFPMGSGGMAVAQAAMNALARGDVHIGDNLTDIVPWRQAPQGFQRIIDGDRSVMGMVIDWTTP